MPLHRLPQALDEIGLSSLTSGARVVKSHQRAGSARARQDHLSKMGATAHLSDYQIGRIRRCMTMAPCVINGHSSEFFREGDIMGSRARTTTPTPLATFVRERLAELEIRQSDFCRLSMFDQGLLSKIQNSVVTSLSLESVLKLA